MEERTGLRDASISTMYRETGVSCYDVDRELVEFATCNPAAREEFKHAHIHEVYFYGKQTKYHQNCCFLMKIPFFIIIYQHRDAENNLINADTYSDLMGLSEKDHPLMYPARLMQVIKHRQYFVLAGNQLAFDLLKGSEVKMTELQFWKFQYEVTKRPIDLKKNPFIHCQDVWKNDVAMPRIYNQPTFIEGSVGLTSITN